MIRGISAAEIVHERCCSRESCSWEGSWHVWVNPAADGMSVPRTDWLSIVNICDFSLCNLSTVSESLFSYSLLTDLLSVYKVSYAQRRWCAYVGISLHWCALLHTCVAWLCVLSMCVSCTCTVDLRLRVSYRFWLSSLTHQVNYHVWHFLHYWFDVVVFTIMVCFSSWVSIMLWLCFVLYSVHMLSCLLFVSLKWCHCSLCVFCTLVVVVCWAWRWVFIELRF